MIIFKRKPFFKPYCFLLCVKFTRFHISLIRDVGTTVLTCFGIKCHLFLYPLMPV